MSRYQTQRHDSDQHRQAMTLTRPAEGTMVTAGALKMQDRKMQDLKMQDQIAGHENAGPENAGPNRRA